MKRFLIVALSVLTTTLMMFAPTAAHAAYPPGSATVSSSSSSPIPGGAITLTAAGFCAGAVVSFSIGGTAIGTATAGTTGSASISATAPTTAGSYTVVASTTNAACPLSASLALTVRAVAAPGDGLPTTGSDSSSGLMMGGLAVVLGAGLLGVAAFRRRPRVAPVAH